MDYPLLEMYEREMVDELMYVYLFNEVAAACGGVRSLPGSKRAISDAMMRSGVPVLPRFTITADACKAYFDNDEEFPPGLWKQVKKAVAEIEAQTGRIFGDPENPLLFSYRSGAKVSLPGMMDTVLNIGLNDEVAEAWVERTGDGRFVYDSYRRLVQMFGTVVLDVPDEAFEIIIAEFCRKAGVETDAELTAEDWYAITDQFKNEIYSFVGEAFPTNPKDHLYMVIEAAFLACNDRPATDHRDTSNNRHDFRPVVNIQTMGDMGCSLQWTSPTRNSGGK